MEADGDERKGGDGGRGRTGEGDPMKVVSFYTSRLTPSCTEWSMGGAKFTRSYGQV